MADSEQNNLNEELAKDTIPVTPIPSLNIEELVENQCVTPADGEYELFFHVSPKSSRDQACDKCGSLNYYKDGKSKDRIVSDVSMGLNRVLLQVEVPRYHCQDCRHKFSHKFDSLMPNMQFTKRLYEQLKRRALSEPFSKLAKEYGVTIPTISKILLDLGKGLDADHPLIAPKVLGIDEKHIEHHMRAIYVDIEHGWLLEMSPDNKQDTLKKVITSMEGYENIQVVTTDMAQGYTPLINEILPKAKVVVDKYHVVQALKVATQKTRTYLTELSHTIVNSMPAGREKTEKDSILTKAGKDSYLFKFKEENVQNDDKRKALMAELCEAFPDFNTLRLLKDGFMRIYQCETAKEAEEAYKDWLTILKTADKDVFSEFYSFNRTVKHWHKEIFQYFEPGCRYTNAAAEGLNSLIQAINSQGRGYGFDALRIKVLYQKEAELPQKVFKKTVTRFKKGTIGKRIVIDRLGYGDYIPMKNMYDYIPMETEYVDKDKRYDETEYYRAVPRGGWIDALVEGAEEYF